MISVVLLAACAALPDTRVAVIVGNNIGIEGDTPLDFAEDDARRVHDLLLDIGGLDAERVSLVLGGTDQDVRQALDRAVGRVFELSRTGPTTLIVYVSAHGDADSLHLEGTRLPLAELRRIVGAAPASLRVTIIDACRRAGLVAPKGGRPGPDVAIAVDRAASVHGEVLIHSAGTGEAAQEWSFLRGSLFTHHLLSGLRGIADVDRDGRVSLAEAYTHAYRQTAIESASSQAGGQHPSFDLKVSGFGEWTMSVPERMNARLVLAEELAGKVWVADRAHHLVVELEKAAGAPVAIALRPGWYRVLRPDGAHAWVTDVNLGWGGTRRLAPDDFVRTSLRRASLRGGDPVVLRPFRAGVSYALQSSASSLSRAAHGVDLNVGRTFGDWLVRARGTMQLASIRSPLWVGRERTVRVGIGGAHLFPIGFLNLSLGAELSFFFLSQELERADGRTTKFFDTREPTRHAVITQLAGTGGISIPVSDQVWIGLEGALGANRVPRWTGEAELLLTGEGRLEVAFTF